MVIGHEIIRRHAHRGLSDEWAPANGTRPRRREGGWEGLVFGGWGRGRGRKGGAMIDRLWYSCCRPCRPVVDTDPDTAPPTTPPSALFIFLKKKYSQNESFFFFFFFKKKGCAWPRLLVDVLENCPSEDTRWPDSSGVG